MSPATTTKSLPSSSDTGQWLPYGPRMPTVSPCFSIPMALVTTPTLRVVCDSRDDSDGSPLIEIGTSPTPKTYTMLNCPGRNEIFVVSSLGTSSSVKVSSVSRFSRSIRNSSGTMGSVMVRSATSASIMAGINVHQLQPGRIQPRRNNIHEAIEHFVSEIMVFLALGAQALGVEHQRSRALQCPRRKMPAIRRRDP